MSYQKVLRTIPNFPNYSLPTFCYPERVIRAEAKSKIILGPPISMYDFHPLKGCTVHVSGIPDWATMADLAEVFEVFGKIFTIELSVTFDKKTNNLPLCDGWALVTFVAYEGAQKALSAHLTRRIPGIAMPLSIYKGIVSNVVLLKNLPMNKPKSDILGRINGYPGLVTIHFVKTTTARMVFEDLDYALLFMDIVSGGGLVIDGFTCTVEPEDKTEEDDE